MPRNGCDLSCEVALGHVVGAHAQRCYNASDLMPTNAPPGLPLLCSERARAGIASCPVPADLGRGSTVSLSPSRSAVQSPLTGKALQIEQIPVGDPARTPLGVDDVNPGVPIGFDLLTDHGQQCAIAPGRDLGTPQPRLAVHPHPLTARGAYLGQDWRGCRRGCGRWRGRRRGSRAISRSRRWRERGGIGRGGRPG
jgi:hypothetical protein